MKQISTGIIYTNPQPYLRSRQAFHPSLSYLGGDELLCTFDIGEAVESLDYRTYVSRSLDLGQTWQLEGPLLEDRCPRPTTLSIRTSLLSDGSLVGFGGRFYRDDPNEGKGDRDTLGMAPMDLILLRSTDKGRTWQGPEVITPPLKSPAWEICHSILELPSGRWLAPCATWRGLKGESPSGEKTVTLISEDQGRTWSKYGVMFDGSQTGFIHWENSVAALDARRLLAVSWVFDPRNQKHLPNEYAFSYDGGLTFSAPRQIGIRGQTAKILRLADGRILCVYRRDDRSGLWANLFRLDGEVMVSLAELPLWGTYLGDSGMTGQGIARDELSALKFGYPSLRQLPDGDVLIAFWGLEGWSSNIHWIRLRIR